MTNLWRQKIPVLIGITAVISFFLGFYASELSTHTNHDTLAIREYDERYKFIRPLLICQIDEQVENKEYRPLEKQIESFINEEVNSGKITSSSVYFRELNTGRWIGINENKPYSPASLLKVPIMMTYLKESEKMQGLLNKKYTYIRKPNDINPLITERFLENGKEYTVNDLLKGMIVQSDNSAKDVLTSHMGSDILNETYSALGIREVYDSDIPQEEYEISTKKYALFFRVLYNGTLLSREMSNKAIELMTEVQFDKGLRAGTPINIPIAHKYGVSVTQIKDSPKYKVELSDCGIIYSQSSPYLLCVMTEGSDPYVLAEVIKKIAEIVYKSTII